jgi:hypothetical protein
VRRAVRSSTEGENVPTARIVEEAVIAGQPTHNRLP